MKNISLVIISSISNNLKSKALTVVFISITLMIVAGLALFFCLLLIAPAIDASVPDRTQLELYLSLIMYTTSIICMGINMNVFAFQSMTKEKSRGNLESLLATPLSAKDIWAAKSLAVFIPGLVLGEVLTFAAMLAINYIYFVPKIGFIYTRWIGLSSFLAVPLIYLCLSLLVHLIGLTGKPAIVLTLMINLILRSVLNAASWPFTLANFGLAAVIAIIIIFLQPRLTREKIVLSR